MEVHVVRGGGTGGGSSSEFDTSTLISTPSLQANSADHDVTWNFGTYFLVDRTGNSVTRHDKVSPASLAPLIEKLLAAPASL